RLRAKHDGPQGVERIDIAGLVPEEHSLEGFEPQPVTSEGRNTIVSGRLDAMFGSDDKQQVALATVFKFELQYGRRPDDGDFNALNEIYRLSATATGIELTAKRKD